MRIRSIKPEFWRSDDIAQLPRDDRLLFIGIWSYVDDNGVGRDQASLIAADLFAHDLSVDPTETLQRVNMGLQRLYMDGLIHRYKGPYNGKDRDFLQVVNWDSHQRIQNPGKTRYPRSDAEQATSRESLHRSSVEPTETLGPGAGEQGSRGAGEQGVGEQSPSAKASPAHKSRKKPETTIPDDWTPTEAHAAKAKEKGVHLETEAENFKLHAEAHDRRLVNWNAGFSTWLNKARPSGGPNGGPPGGPYPPRQSGADAALQRGKERHEQLADYQPASWADVFTPKQIGDGS